MRTLTYVSQAIAPMSGDAFRLLGVEASRLNALDGITGLLVFNGRSFCQTIEGASAAIDDLLIRLRRDPRHDDLRIIADEWIAERRFRSWDMQLFNVPHDRDAALAIARKRLRSDADVEARAKVYDTVVGAFA